MTRELPSVKQRAGNEWYGVHRCDVQQKVENYYNRHLVCREEMELS